VTQLNYITGDVTNPQLSIDQRHVVIPHVCNDIGSWGAGVSGAIGKAFPEAERQYRRLGNYHLGMTDFVQGVGPDRLITIANMIAQRSVGEGTTVERVLEPHHSEPGSQSVRRPPIRYGALTEAMQRVAMYCYADGKPWCSIHMPQFGSALAGGHWPVIEQLVFEIWLDKDIEVTVYRFPG